MFSATVLSLWLSLSGGMISTPKYVAIPPVPPDAVISYHANDGIFSAAITVTIVCDDKCCTCIPVVLAMWAGCPASGAPALVLPGYMDPVSGRVEGESTEPIPNLAPLICGAPGYLAAVCGGDDPCPIAQECTAVDCVH